MHCYTVQNEVHPSKKTLKTLQFIKQCKEYHSKTPASKLHGVPSHSKTRTPIKWYKIPCMSIGNLAFPASIKETRLSSYGLQNCVLISIMVLPFLPCNKTAEQGIPGCTHKKDLLEKPGCRTSSCQMDYIPTTNCSCTCLEKLSDFESSINFALL